MIGPDLPAEGPIDRGPIHALTCDFHSYMALDDMVLSSQEKADLLRRLADRPQSARPSCHLSTSFLPCSLPRGLVWDRTFLHVLGMRMNG